MIMENQGIQMDVHPEAGEFFHLLPKKRTVLDKIAHALWSILIFPVRALQIILGRLLSYFIFNPLFRKQEQELYCLKENKKYPDPALVDQDDIIIVDLLPEYGFWGRIVSNWIHGAKSLLQHTFHLPVDFSSTHHTHHDRAFIARLVRQVHSQLSQNIKPEQIHLKGLYSLSASQRTLLLNTLQEKYAFDFNKNSNQYNFFQLKTTTSDMLDSLEVRGPSAVKHAIENRTFIISCLPRTHNYTNWIKQHRYFADQLDTTIVAFNYRGTGKSKGLIINQHDMQHDVMAQVKRLLAMGAKPENIALMGECLGANIATQVAATLHKNNQKVKLFNIRSFRSAPALLLGTILPPKKEINLLNPLHGGRIILAGLALITVVPLLYLTGWDLSIDSAFKSIPVKDRDYLVVRSKKDEHGKRYRDDRLISHAYASIYSLIKEEQNRLKTKRTCGDSLSTEEQAWLADNRSTHKFHVDKAQRPDADKTDGHTCQLRYLAKTTPETSASPDGRAFVLNFFHNAWKTPQEKANAIDVQMQAAA